MAIEQIPLCHMDASSESRRSPLLGFDGTSSASLPVRSRRQANSTGNADEMVRRLSEISTSSISFDANKLAMYKNFSGRSNYARDLDGEALGRNPRRCRTTAGYPATRSPAISEVEDLEAFGDMLKREKEKIESPPSKSVITFDKASRKSKTTVVSL